jgi:hypothetical protein
MDRSKMAKSSTRASKILQLLQQVQELSRDIENAQIWHDLLLHRLVHGRGGVWTAMRHSLPYSRTSASTSIMPAIAIDIAIPHSSSCHQQGATLEKVSEQGQGALRGETETETESADVKTTVSRSRRRGHATGTHKDASPMISLDEFINMDATSKRDRVRQGILLQEDKIRSILSRMKERMVTVDKENEADMIESQSI